MSSRTREWLRGFLKLGARAEQDGIPAADVERQEDTVIRALDMLDERPGVVLADEVGMGKTFEALGIAATIQHQKRRSRIVVVTPGPDLNTKWRSEFPRFKEMFDFGDDVQAVNNLADFVQSVRDCPVVIAPVTMFGSGRASGDQVYLLSLYFHWKGLHGHTANAIMARFREGKRRRIDVRAERFLGKFALEEVEPHLQAAFHRKEGAWGVKGLDNLYEEGGYDAFWNEWAVRDALYRARFILTNRLIPMVDLLIVDEAHKLKNPGSLRTRGVQRIFENKFCKALFLTATPFQLDVGELGEIFRLFSRAKGAPRDLEEQVKGLLATVGEYQGQYETFQNLWSSLDPVAAEKFCAIYESGQGALNTVEDPALQVVAQQVQTLRDLKDKSIEPGFRQWMIRSLRKDKRVYRRHERRRVEASGAGALPFLIYERFIAELFRRRRQTHKAAVEINMASSYGAAKDGAILASEDGIPPEAEEYRGLLRDVLGEFESSAQEHPKLSDVITDALDAADRGEKTLIFCARVATLQQLQKQLDGIWQDRILERWRQVYPDAGKADIDTRHRNLHERFRSTDNLLYLAMREPYLRTLEPAVAKWASGHVPEIMAEANRIIVDLRVGKTAAKERDYQIVKRCVEQAAARLWIAADHPGASEVGMVEHLAHPAYARLGLDHKKDEYEKDEIGSEQPQWRIMEEGVVRVIGAGGSLWEHQTDLLDALDRDLRVQVVEQLRTYLTYRQVPFLVDLLTEVHRAGIPVERIEAATLLNFMPRFWESETGKHWIGQVREFLEYLKDRDPHQQSEILSGPIRKGDFARHTRDGESRERLREAFNTPLFPMILVANEAMQEGLDLHKHCRRIVHHDLAWNPAQIEQRIGRIDRLGSLTSRLRERDSETRLDVLYPVIRGTIDERLYRSVKTREKWLEFLLGAPPNFGEYTFADEAPPPLPDSLASDLAIDLGPREAGR